MMGSEEELSRFGSAFHRAVGMDRHAKAIELKLGIESGIYSPEEAIAWADEYIANNEYDDDIANISMAVSKPRAELASLLGKVAVGQDCVVAMRKVLGRMALELEKNEKLAKCITAYCERFWFDQGCELPDEMMFMAGVDDLFELAIQGIYGTEAEARTRLMSDLNRFRRYADGSDAPDVADSPWA
jgi:hypothetical protein